MNAISGSAMHYSQAAFGQHWIMVQLDLNCREFWARHVSTLPWLSFPSRRYVLSCISQVEQMSESFLGGELSWKHLIGIAVNCKESNPTLDCNYLFTWQFKASRWVIIMSLKLCFFHPLLAYSLVHAVIHRLWNYAFLQWAFFMKCGTTWYIPQTELHVRWTS